MSAHDCESCWRHAPCVRSVKDFDGNVGRFCCRCSDLGECEDCEAIREKAEKWGVPESEVRG